MTEHKIREAMGYLEPALVQEADQPVVHKRRRLQAMLVAACLAALCAISVAAVSSGLLVQLKDRFSYEVWQNGRIPVTTLSEAVQKDTQTDYIFDTWEDMETYLGIELIDNSELDKATLVESNSYDKNEQFKERWFCKLHLTRNDESVVYGGLAQADYRRNGLYVSVIVKFTTDANPYENASGHAMEYPQGTMEMYEETYKTAKGYPASIVGVKSVVTESWQATSWIDMGGVTVGVTVYGGTEDISLEQSKQILDAFQ